MLGGLDLFVFFGFLAAVMAIGLWAARQEDSAEEFYLAGRSVGWLGVAGSIFGTNVSAAHLVGMLGIGFSIGFAQSHFELGAIAALMLLAYGFLPVYRRLQIYTLSDYLRRRYDGRSQTLYTVILLVVTVVQVTAAFYIGSRSLGLLLADTPIEVGYVGGIVVLAIITASYTIFGGLKAVIYTDVMQSILLLFAGILLAILTFAQPEVGGWSGMMAHDAARAAAEQKMHLYLPPSHPDLPWTGALTGLLVLHCFYWSTNQAIVQRALAAKSDGQARAGIVVAGFMKLLIPFFAIAGGVAAAQLFELRMPGRVIDPDAATPELIRLVIPAGFGLMGVIMAGLIGAILSSIDSMVNSAATLFAFDVYKKFVRPEATEDDLLPVGRWVIALLVAGSALLAIATYDPEGDGNFFLRVSSQAGHFTPGIIVAFALGMFWRRAHPRGALAAIAAAPFFSFAVVWFYGAFLGTQPGVAELFGPQLNFMHRVFLTVLFGTAVHVLVSRSAARSAQGEQYTYAAVGGHEPQAVRTVLTLVAALALSLGGLGLLVWQGIVPPTIAAFVAAALAFLPFAPVLRERGFNLRDDRAWSALLCAATCFLMFVFF
ncbi:MAG: sodium/solute symporter [Acidobacteriota bacterium]